MTTSTEALFQASRQTQIEHLQALTLMLGALLNVLKLTEELFPQDDQLCGELRAVASLVRLRHNDLSSQARALETAEPV